MGMFEKPVYLTGKEEGYVQPGDVFWLHACKIDGQTSVGGTPRDQAKLRVSLTKEGATTDVFSGGAGIVNQVKRMTQEDRAAFPIEVRLDQVPSKHASPTFVLTPADQPAPSGGFGGADASTDDEPSF